MTEYYESEVIALSATVAMTQIIPVSMEMLAWQVLPLILLRT